MSATTEYGVDLLVQLGIGRQSGTGAWDSGHWGSTVWGNPDTSLGDWVEVTCETVTPFTLTAGASDADGVVTRWEAATCALTLAGAQWDPWAGPWAGIVGPQVALRVSWRKTGTTPWLAAFTGTVAPDGWAWVPGESPYVHVSATDSTATLAAYDPVEQTPQGLGETAAARVHRILDMATWPAGLRDVTAGGVKLKSSTMAEALWTQLLAVADTDLALLWVKRDGRLAFRPEGRVGVGVDLAARLVICPAAPPVPNVGPVARFTHTESALTTTVNAATSTDADGTIVAYAWTFGDGATGTGVTTSHPYVAAGTYPVRLTVTDDDGATNSVTHSVIVTAPLPLYDTMVVADGAVSYWQFREASGALAVDSLRAANATLSGGYARGAAPIAPGLGLSTSLTGGSGLTDWLPPPGGHPGPFTWEQWLCPTGLGGGYTNIIDAASNFNVYFQSNDHIDAKIRAIGGDLLAAFNFAFTPPVSANAVVHIAFAVEAAKWRFYINGVQVGTGTFTGSVGFDGYLRFAIDNQFNGRISDAAMYHTALSAATIANHYTVGMAPRPTMRGVIDAAGTAAEPTEIQVVTIGGAQFSDIRNVVSVSRQKEDGGADAATVTVRDDASGARYLRRAYARTDLQHQADAWSTTVANAVLASSAWPSQAPREAQLSSLLGNPAVPALLLTLEPDQTFDVEDTGGRLWREGCVGWAVTVSRTRIDGTVQLTDMSKWVGAKWDSAHWNADNWSYAVTLP